MTTIYYRIVNVNAVNDLSYCNNCLVETESKNYKFERFDGYSTLHRRVRSRKPQPENCELCGKPAKLLDLANISQKYLEDLDDWEYLCRSCHMNKDNRADAFVKLAGTHGRKVQKLNLEGDFIEEYESSRAAAQINNIESTSIVRCANGENKTAGGFKWKYVEQRKKVADTYCADCKHPKQRTLKTKADFAYDNIVHLTNIIGRLSEQLSVVAKEYQELKDAED